MFCLSRRIRQITRLSIDLSGRLPRMPFWSICSVLSSGKAVLRTDGGRRFLPKCKRLCQKNLAEPRGRSFFLSQRARTEASKSLWRRRNIQSHLRERQGDFQLKIIIPTQFLCHRREFFASDSFVCVDQFSPSEPPNWRWHDTSGLFQMSDCVTVIIGLL